MSRIKIGKVALNPKGNWVSTTTYEKLDIVTSGSKTFIARQDIPTGTTTSSTTYWQELAANGIVNTEKISTSGVVDTYRQTYGSGGHFDYTVTNASSGEWGSITGDIEDQNDLIGIFNQISSPSKNLYNKDADNTVWGYFLSGTGSIIANASSCIVWVPVTGGKAYTVSKTIGERFSIAESIDQPAVGTTVTMLTSGASNPSLSVTTSASTNYLAILIWNSSLDTTITEAQMKASVQVEEGLVATSYVPYGRTATDTTARSDSSNALSSLADLSFLGDITLLDSGTDLDNLTDGVTYSDTSTRTNSLIHCPIYNTNCKIITFTRYSTYKMQICIGGSRRVYFRASAGAGYTTWREFGNDIEELKILPSGGVTPTYGEELCPTLSGFTGTDATWNDSAWVFSEGGSISTSMSVTANKVYLIAFTVTNPYTGADADGVPGYLTVALGNDSTTFFAANDAYWYLALKPTASGTVTFSVTSVNHWTGNITGISIKEVTSYAPVLMQLYSQNVRFIYGNNLGIGGMNTLAIGAENTAFGKDAQVKMEAARWNTAVGNATQRYLRNGTGNTAVGYSAQGNIQSGCYNNCIGNGAQQAITIGNWNNAFGNEAQLELTSGCNNVNIGRRSGTALKTGNFNTHIGTWTGFIGTNTTPGVDDNRNTIGASFQTLIGGKARQIDHQSDYLTAVGYGSQGDDKAVAIGAGAIAKGENSIAIGYGVSTSNNNEVAIGINGQKIILAGKTITFNPNGTITWE